MRECVEKKSIGFDGAMEEGGERIGLMKGGRAGERGRGRREGVREREGGRRRERERESPLFPNSLRHQQQQPQCGSLTECEKV